MAYDQRTPHGPTWRGPNNDGGNLYGAASSNYGRYDRHEPGQGYEERDNRGFRMPAPSSQRQQKQVPLYNFDSWVKSDPPNRGYQGPQGGAAEYARDRGYGAYHAEQSAPYTGGQSHTGFPEQQYDRYQHHEEDEYRQDHLHNGHGNVWGQQDSGTYKGDAQNTAAYVRQQTQPVPSEDHGQEGQDRLYNNHNSHQTRNQQLASEERKSPGALPWDNPFPTFHAQPRKRSKGQHSGGQNFPDRDGPTESEGKPSGRSDRRNEYSGNDRGQDRNKEGWQNGGSDYPPQRPQLSRSARSDSYRSCNQRPNPGPDGFDHVNNVYGSQNHHFKPHHHGPEDGLIPAHEPQHATFHRSQTMPAAISHTASSQEPSHGHEWQVPGAISGYYGPEPAESFPDGISHDQNGATRMPGRANSDEARRIGDQRPGPDDNGSRSQDRGHQRDYGQSYSQSSDQLERDFQGSNSYQPGYLSHRTNAVGDEMPNFEAMQDQNARDLHGMTLNHHLQSRGPRPGAHHYPSDDAQSDLGQPLKPYANDAYPRSRSQPDFEDHRFKHPTTSQGYGPPRDYRPDQRPATSTGAGRHGPYGPPPGRPLGDRRPGRPFPAGPPSNARDMGNGRPPPLDGRRGNPGTFPDPRAPGQHRSPPMQNGRSSNEYPRKGGPSPPVRMGLGGPPPSPPPPPPKSSSNPDALPHHPAPVRAGHLEGPTIHSNNKPPPVRHYSDTSSPGEGVKPSKRVSVGDKPVTYQELDKLRSTVSSHPDDQATRFLLARKLVEASTILVDERNEPRTRAKAREDYIMQAQKIFKKLASNGHAEALFYLGDSYSRGSLGLANDAKEAFTSYQSAAKINHAQAAYRVAVCCEIGLEEGGGTKKDPLKAMQWYRRAAELGDTSGMYKMGIIQLKGLLGQPKNPKDALAWLKRAAGHADEENPHALHEMVSY